MVSTLDSESSDPSSNLGGTYNIFFVNIELLFCCLRKVNWKLKKKNRKAFCVWRFWYDEQMKEKIASSFGDKSAIGRVKVVFKIQKEKRIMPRPQNIKSHFNSWLWKKGCYIISLGSWASKAAFH